MCLKKCVKKYTDLSFWKRGSAEVTGYMVVLPSLCIFLIMMICIIQYGTITTRLQYTAYVACRAAVICEDLDTASEKAQLAAETNIGLLNSSAFDEDSIETDLICSEGKASDMLKKNRKRKNTDDEEWIKGNYVTCFVTVYVNTFLEQLSGEKTASITMMIERPAEDGISDILSDKL